MQHGVDRSAETLAIEGELASIQQKSSEWHEERRELSAKILTSTGHNSNSNNNSDPLTHKDKLLTNEVLNRNNKAETYSTMNKMAEQQREAIEAIRKRQEERSKSLPRTAGDGCERKSAVERLFGSSSVKPSNGISNNNNNNAKTSTSSTTAAAATYQPTKPPTTATTTSSIATAFQSPIARRIAEEVERASQVRKDIEAKGQAAAAAAAAPPPVPPRNNNKAATPDVVKSTLPEKKSILESIDNLFGAPEKIHIPERYIPEEVSFIQSWAGKYALFHYLSADHFTPLCTTVESNSGSLTVGLPDTH